MHKSKGKIQTLLPSTFLNLTACLLNFFSDNSCLESSQCFHKNILCNQVVAKLDFIEQVDGLLTRGGVPTSLGGVLMRFEGIPMEGDEDGIMVGETDPL